MAIIEIQEQTEAEVFAASGLVCPNGCPVGTGWTYCQEVCTSHVVRVGRVEDAEEENKGELTVIVDKESEVWWDYTSDEHFECNGCDFVMSAEDVTHDWD
jgi:hypothetical protein